MKYDRFDPPLLSATSSSASAQLSHKNSTGGNNSSSPEFEAMPPLILGDMMSDPEMQDLFNRQTSLLNNLSQQQSQQQPTAQSPPVQDLMTFQVV